MLHWNKIWWQLTVPKIQLRKQTSNMLYTRCLYPSCVEDYPDELDRVLNERVHYTKNEVFH